MISWVIDRVPARTVDGRESHTIIVYREAETLGDFRRAKWRVRAVTESLLACEQRGEAEWYLPSVGVVLLADRKMVQSEGACASDAAAPPPEQSE